MAGKLKCKVCGKEYDGCRSTALSGDTFRWQDVACSQECGNEYFRQVMIARGMLAEDPDVLPVVPEDETPDIEAIEEPQE